MRQEAKLIYIYNLYMSLASCFVEISMKDSVDKIITRYFACVTREEFLYKGKLYSPKPLKVSPLLLRGYTCPSQCGACCLAYTLDYLPNDDKPPNTHQRFIRFNGKNISVWSYMQDDHDSLRCKHLDTSNGRCGIYPVRAFSCDFELIRSLEFGDADLPNVLTQKLYGRGWNMLRIDDVRGAMCEMTSASEESKTEVIRKLRRLRKWTLHFGLKRTWISDIIRSIKNEMLVRPIVFSDTRSKEGFGI